MQLPTRTGEELAQFVGDNRVTLLASVNERHETRYLGTHVGNLQRILGPIHQADLAELRTNNRHLTIPNIDPSSYNLQSRTFAKLRQAIAEAGNQARFTRATRATRGTTNG